MVLLNTGEGTRLNPENGIMNALDLTVTTPEVASNCHWEVLGEFLGSDHSFICTTIDFEPVEGEVTFLPKFKLTQADWPEFARRCDDTPIIWFSLNKRYLTV